MRGAPGILCAAAALGLALVATPGAVLAAQDDLPAFLSRLGSPARPAVVREILDRRLDRSPEDARRLASALLRAGGVGALDGLVPLVRHDDPETRAEAMRAAAAIGVRHYALAAAVREVLARGDSDSRAAACAVLARIGDARDVLPLIAACEALDSSGAADAGVRAAAATALRGLTGLSIPGVPSRWSHWWTKTRYGAPGRVADALATLECCSTTSAARHDASRAEIARWGWLDLDAVVAAARSWLRSWDPRLRMEGCRIAAALRLGDVADDVQSTAAYATRDDVWTEAAKAAEVLGLRLDGLRSPPTSNR